MIYTVTLNPSLDKALTVPHWQLGELNRAQLVRLDLGGKGVNVTRALAALGVTSEIILLAGGSAGKTLCDGLIAAGYRVHAIPVEGETRYNITLHDQATETYTKLNEAGPEIGSVHVQALERMVHTLARRDDLWAFCGSLPPGAPPDLYGRLINLVQAQGGRGFLDTSGAALAAGLGARPYCLKPNTEEAAELLGRPLPDDSAHVAAARRLLSPDAKTGPHLVAITRGADGLVLAQGRDLIFALPPTAPTRSTVGAGDAALAGLLWATLDGSTPAETARRAIACGTATAMQEGTGVGDRATVDALLPKVVVTRLQ